MEIVLEEKDAVDWSYRGEGAVNLVLAYTGSSPSFLGKMMRIQKTPNKCGNENGDTSENGLTTHEKLIWAEIEELVTCQNKEILEYLFVNHVMKPLLGHKYVNAGVRLLVAKEFLESVAKVITSQRPSWRADAASVDPNRTSVLLMDDLTLFTHGHVEDKPCLSVEIKPKCGFLPSSSFIAEENVIKKTKTRFEMHQVLKLKENEISEISEYDPLDLFSGTRDRIHKAIRSLYATPQNNFRVFLNGSLVFGGLGGGICKTTSKVEQAFEHLLKDIIESEDDDGERANHFIELVAETVYASGVLNQLLEVQKLDKYNIEGAIHVYYDLIEQPCKVCREFEKKESKFSSLHSIPVNEKVKILKEFLISATAKDCSVMISFRSAEDGGMSRSSSSHSTLQLESTKQEFDYKVHFIDLDMRPLKKMEVYYELDKKITNTYMEMKKEALGGRRDRSGTIR